jgi:hypothetical protein
MTHRASLEQWSELERYLQVIDNPIVASFLIELRDRIEALEAATDHRAILDSSPAPAVELVERVAEAIGVISTTQATARAAILAVAEWFDGIGYGATASILRQEVQRHG